VASALNVHEQPGQTPIDALVPRLQTGKALLVLDNCEHLITACAELAQALLPICPELTLLATSREPLAIARETVWPVPPLSLPETDHLPLEKLLESEAVRLFAERCAGYPLHPRECEP
jgi:predicted ATPase